MTASEKEKLIAKHMNLLDISREEAEQLVADDEAIDKGAKLFELTPEQEKASKQARQGPRKKNSKPTVRERKADEDKRYLIGTLQQAVGLCQDVVVTNPERQIDFVYNGRKFRIVLSAPRS